MILQALAFYVFAFVVMASAAMVVVSRNPVYSVLFLILAFFNAAALFVLIGAEFIAMILIIVYVGAVAVLFLFVVMMLDINFRELRAGTLQYLPIGITVGLVLLVELALVLGTWVVSPDLATVAAAPTPTPDQVTNTHALGLLIYTHYAYLFQAAGLILLIAMIGAIVLTLRSREGVRRQNISNQVSRRRDEVVAIRKVPTRGGI
jgi:NADH-quinone oxidoreductase subunit J